MVGIAGVAALWFLRPAAEAELPTAAVTPASTPRRTTSETAYDLYLQGIFNRSRRDINGGELALADFEAALKEDPYYADAWAALADTLSGAAMTQYLPTVPSYERARSAALRAIELDDEIGARACGAGAHQHDVRPRFRKAETEIERAAGARSEATRASGTRSAILRAFQGRLPEALDAIRRARELEPMTLLYNSNYGLLLYTRAALRRGDRACEVTARLAAAARPGAQPVDPRAGREGRRAGRARTTAAAHLGETESRGCGLRVRACGQSRQRAGGDRAHRADAARKASAWVTTSRSSRRRSATWRRAVRRSSAPPKITHSSRCGCARIHAWIRCASEPCFADVEKKLYGPR